MTTTGQIIRHVLEAEEDDDSKDVYFPEKPHTNFTDADVDTAGTLPRLSVDRDQLIHLPLPWQKRGLQYTASGYGAKIPSSYCILFNGKTYRLYTTCYGNSGSTWFVTKGRKIFVTAF